MEAKELTQAKRDVVTQLLTAHGWTNTLELLNGHAFKEGRLTRPALDPMAADLLPHLATAAAMIEFYQGMEFVSIDGRPPVRKAPPAHANDNEGPPPEILNFIKAITGGTAPRNPKTRPHATDEKQGNLF